MELFLFAPVEVVPFNAQPAVGALFAQEYLWSSCCGSSAVCVCECTKTDSLGLDKSLEFLLTGVFKLHLKVGVPAHALVDIPSV